MARYTGPKNKLSRRAGVDLGLKTSSAKLSRRLNIPPGQHGRKGVKKTSEYGVQLREKQKLKWTYGVLEKQFHNYYLKAAKKSGETGKEMIRLLECRLDNIVYRLGFAPTRASARQIVVHGHIKVDGAKVDRPSYQIKPEMKISLSQKISKTPAVAAILEEKSKNIPAWLEKQGLVGKVKHMPQRENLDIDINENLVVEYYSR